MLRTGKFYSALIFGSVLLFLLAFTQVNDLFFQIKKQLTIFSDVYKEIATQYVDEVGPEKLMRSGIDSMLKTLDPYTEFIAEGEQQQMEILSSGSYGGIGIEAGYRGDDIVVIAPLDGAPAQRAGLKPGDVLKKINSLEVQGMSPEEVRELTIGDAGTKITLEIVRRGIDDPIEFELVRERIEIKNINVTAKIGPNKEFGYIQLTRFGQQSAEEIRQALISFQQGDHFDGLILDLRNNPGGLLNEAVEIVDKFVEPGVTIVETRGRLDTHNSVISSEEPALFKDLPVVVLINNGSASASEILAGVFQDLDRAVILGERSFGKGLVQTIRPLSYNTSLKITISRYYIPSGRSIQSANYLRQLNDDSVDLASISRREFKTKNGRTVYDGIGIEPDVTVTENSESLLDLALKRENKYLFFINDLINGSDRPDKPDNLFERFTTSLIEDGFTFETPADRHLRALESNITRFSNEGTAKSNLEELNALLRDYKISQIYENESQLEKELNYQWIMQTLEGEERNLEILQQDKLVQEALDLLSNRYKFQTILRP